MSKIGVIVVDLHADHKHPDLVTIGHGLQTIKEQVTKEITWVFLEIVGSKVHPAIRQLKPDATIISKYHDDAFEERVFRQYIQKQKLETLFVCGYNEGCCVKALATSGLKKGYNIVVSPNMMTCYSSFHSLNPLDPIEGELLEQNIHMKQRSKSYLPSEYTGTVFLETVADVVSYLNKI